MIGVLVEIYNTIKNKGGNKVQRENISVFETNTEDNPPADKEPDLAIIDTHVHHDLVDPVQSDITAHHNPVNQQNVVTTHQNPVNPVISVEQRRST